MIRVIITNSYLVKIIMLPKNDILFINNLKRTRIVFYRNELKHSANRILRFIVKKKLL
jgi:hypothetical protein